MASLNPCSAPSNKAESTSAAAAAATTDGALLLDALWEVLLRLSAKELCRLRVVCRLWRSITSDRAFIAAHLARHPGPLLVGGLRNGPMEPRGNILVMDMSGNVVKRIPTMGPYSVLPTQLDLVCVTSMRIRQGARANVLNPATGAVHTLPENLARAHSHGSACSNYEVSFMFGQALMGEYKALRVFTTNSFPTKQIIEVCTVNTSNTMQWREKQAPLICVQTGDFNAVVMNGVVYFLLLNRFNGSTDKPGVCSDSMALFDLNTEEWISSCLKGPISSHPELNNMLYPSKTFFTLYLAKLSDFLVLAAHNVSQSGSSLDLWYLMDLEKCIWERKYGIRFGKVKWGDGVRFVTPYPLMVLQDGSILICVHELRSNGPNTLVRIYDPKTNTLGADMINVRNIRSVAVYAGSLLNVQNDDEL